MDFEYKEQGNGSIDPNGFGYYERGNSDDICVGVQLNVVRLYYSKAASKNPLLHDINFLARPGQITAIMGPSRERRTTLLEVIAQRRRYGRYSGEVLVSGMPRGGLFVHNTGYVPRHPLFFEGLTYEESVRFKAQLSLGSNASKEEVGDRVLSILRLLDLQWCKDQVVGDLTFRGKKGGQLRRLSIALEAVGLPAVMFLDEPVSLLESAVALDTMEHLKALTQRNHTLILTLDMPSPELFALVDKVVLLSQSRLIFTGTPQEAVSYFTAEELGYHLDDTLQVAGFLVDIAQGIERPKQSRRREPLPPSELSQRFSASVYSREALMGLGGEGGGGREGEGSLGGPTQFDAMKSYPDIVQPPSPLRQFLTLYQRTITSKIRYRQNVIAGFIRCLFFALFLGLLQRNQFSNVGEYLATFLYGPYPAASNISAMWFYASAFSFSRFLISLHEYVQVLILYRKEQFSGISNPFPIWLTMILTEIPLECIYQLGFNIVLWWLVGFDWSSSSDFWLIYFTTCVSVCIGMIAVFVFATLTQDESKTRNLLGLVMIVSALSSGYVCLVPELSDVWSVISDASPLRWIFQSIMGVTWKGYYDSEILLGMYGFEGKSKSYPIRIALIIAMSMAVAFLVALFPPPSRLQHFRWRLKEARSHSKADDTFYDDNDDSSSDISSLRISSNSDYREDEMFDTANLQSPLVITKGNINTNQSNGQQGQDMHQVTSDDENENDYDDDDDDDEGQYHGGLDFGFDDREDLLIEGPDDPSVEREGFSISFKKIEYTVPSKDFVRRLQGQRDTVLRNVGGKMDAGQITAIMGMTDSGKTSLLKVLACRAKPTIGTILYDDSIPTKKIINRCAYIMAEECHLEHLTVRETVEFAARIRFEEDEIKQGKTGGMTLGEIKRKVKSAIQMTGLSKLAYRRVGQLTKAARKRVSIAQESVVVPRAIFVDEPTTGLNAPDMLEVMNCLAQMAGERRTVVITLHQPILPVFEALDKVLLLSEGRVVYGGSPQKIVRYFSREGLEYEMSPGKNPADWITDIAGGLAPSSSGDILDSITLAMFWQKSKEFEEDQRGGLSRIPTRTFKDWEEEETVGSSPYFNDSFLVSSYPRSYLSSIYLLLKRQFCRLFRMWKFLLMQFFIAGPLLGLVVGWLFWDNETNAYNVFSYDGFSAAFIFLAQLGLASTIWEQHRVFMKERQQGLYTPIAHWLCSFFPLFLLPIASTTVYILISRPMVGLDTDRQGFALVLYNAFGVAVLFLHLLILSLVPTIREYYKILPALTLLEMSFTGLIANLTTLDSYLGAWGPSCSIFRWVAQSAMLNEANGNENIFPEIEGTDYSLFDSWKVSMGYDTHTKTDCLYYIFYHMIVYAVLLLIVNMSFKNYRVYGLFPPPAASTPLTIDEAEH